MQSDANCQEAVRRVQAGCHALDLPEPDDSTSGYCQARLRLSVECLRKVHDSLVQKLSRGSARRICGGSLREGDRRLRRLHARHRCNRQVYPYAGGQKPGCSFPTAKLVGLFSLSGGHGRNCWRRPYQRLAGWTEEFWGTLPEQIEVRLVTFQGANVGSRTRTVTLATTLLDETEYHDEALIAFYSDGGRSRTTSAI